MYEAISDSDWIPDSAIEWYDWLSAEEDKTRKSYLAKPANLISEYRRETSISREYEGRELLELLQNAADSAREAGEPGRVVVEITPESMIIANTGKPFTIGGVSSLETSNLSPKRLHRRQYIGNKGLGFRSVLNWTYSPIILSGALALTYSRKHLGEVLESLVAANKELRSRVEAEIEGGEELPVATLPFPVFSKNGDLHELLRAGADNDTVDRCLHWRSEGYDTVVAMPFIAADRFDAACEQRDELRAEILLFVEYLAEIRFITEGENAVSWRLDRDGNSAMVSEDGEALGIWELFAERESIPAEILESDQQRLLDYEVMVAVPEVESTDEFSSSTLFSYFPTQIDFPLPVVAHATLELDQSRNHALQSTSNAFVFERLAEFLAEVAEQRSERFPIGAKSGFHLVAPLATYPVELRNVSFPEALLEAAKSKKIIPTLDGQARFPASALQVNASTSSWLPAAAFADIVASDGLDLDLVDSLEVPEIDEAALRKRLISHSKYSFDERVTLISGLIESWFDDSAYSSALLLDHRGGDVPDNATVFLAPGHSEFPPLPDWIKLRFLNDGLRDSLLDRLEAQDHRELQKTLAGFGVAEYSLGTLVHRLVAASKSVVKERPEDAAEVNRELLEATYFLYRSRLGGVKGGRETPPPHFPSNVNYPLPNQSGKRVSARTLYLGAGYGADGAIVQSLLEKCAPEKLVASPESVLPNVSPHECIHFLHWLGVAKWPRKIIAKKVDRSFLEYVLERIQYPARFEEYHVSEYEYRRPSDVKNPLLERVSSLDCLEAILANAGAYAISAWLGRDRRAPSWRHADSENGKLSALERNHQKRRVYEGRVPNYVSWKLSNTPWLVNQDGENVRPTECVIGERAIEALFSRPAMMPNDLLENYGLEQREVYDGWRNAGVPTGLADLDMDEIYSRALLLPERDPSGKSARGLYHWMLDASDLVAGSSRMRDTFVSTGQMWGHFEGKSGYFAVTDLLHADTEGLPKVLLERLKIVSLRRRSGAEKVKNVFGVESIDRMEIRQRVIRHQVSQNLDSEFQAAKPFFLLLRAAQTSRTQYLKALRDLSIRVCSEVTAEMEYLDEEFEYKLPDWEWIIDGDILYVSADPAEFDARDSDLLADAIGEAIAALFRIGAGGDFARMFRCRSQDRKALLKKMRGEDAAEDMAKVIDQLGTPSPSVPTVKLPDGEIQEPALVDAGDLPDGSEDEESVDSGQGSETLDGDKAHEEAVVGIGQVQHVPEPPKKPKKLQIRSVTTASTRTSSSRAVTDGNFTELKVVEFEEAQVPPRYALRVGHLTGSDAPGCDILSFRSDSERQLFKSGTDRDYGSVERFIEVKGRSNRRASIELSGNEKRAAERFGSKYYLYRLFERDDGVFEISILQDPLRQSEALEPSVHVDLDRANLTERFEISGGMRRN